MRFAVILGVLAVLAGPAGLSAQAMDVVEPYKVGTFEIGGTPTVSLVLRDQLIVDIQAANRSLETNPAYAEIPMPDDMLELIGRYEYGLKYRLYEIVSDRGGRPPGGSATSSDLVRREGPRHLRSSGALDRSEGVFRQPDGGLQADT